MSGTPSQRREMEETPCNSISTSQSIDNNAQQKAAATITATASATSSAETIMQPSHEVVATNTESVEVHVPGLTSPLHLTLPRTINQTTVKELRKMIIKQLRALDSDTASSNNPVGVSRVVNSNKNKVFFIRLMFRGKELQKDANTLASEHIKDGSAVHAMRTFVQPEYQRRQAAERKRQRAIQKNAIQQQTSHEQSLQREQRREEEEESSEEEEEEENDENNSSNSIRRNITSSLMPLSQQNLHEARQALVTALSAFWPTNDPADENYNDISNSADHNLGSANTSVRDGADTNSNRDNSVMSINANNNNNNNNINLDNDDRSSVSTHSSADRRRVARSRLNNAELLRLIQAERVRSAQSNSYNQDLAPGLQIREPQSQQQQQQQQQEQRSELLQTSLPNSNMTTGALFASSPAHERPFQLHQGGSSNIHTLANTTTNAPLATTSTTITTGGDGSVIDNSTVRSNDAGRVRMMELADGNNSNLRRGTTNTMRSTAFNNVNGSGGAGGNNRADDIEARIEAERQYFWKEFTVNFVIGLLLGPIGFIFPNDTLGKIAIILGMITNILCLMLTSTVNEYSWEIY